ncbi:MAG: glycosyltransferase [Candidatus Zixiibacteriota bacterium]
MKNSSANREVPLINQDIICVSSMPYAGMWTRKQRLMTILARAGNRVLYVEPVETTFASEGNKGEWSDLIQEIEKNLWILKPPGRLPLARFAFMRDLNFRRYVNSIRKHTRKLKFQKPVLFTYTPVIHAHSPFLRMRGSFDESILVYDCVDEHSETIGYTTEAARVVHEMDLDLTSRADIVFVTARGLYEDRKHLNDKMYFSPNGAEVSHFSRALLDETKIPDDLSAIPGPRIGFVGALSKWIDFELIGKIAERYPEYNIALVGPAVPGPHIEMLKSIGNVYFLGKKKLEELPGYLKGFDCGINPFKRVGISEKVNPLKIYEYLAAGLPVISIDMPEILPFEGAILVARDDEQFIDGAGKIISGEFSPDADMVSDILNRHDWNVIFDDQMRKISDLINT